MRPNESFVGQPIRSLQTMLRVIAQDDPRLPVLVPDGIYGPTTAQAVTAFQRINGIPVTGVVDQATWEAIVPVYEATIIKIEKAEPIEISLDPGQILKLGDSSPYIYLLQSMLTQLSNDHVAIPQPTHSGVLDIQTAASISAFQALADLPETGEFDKITWMHIVKHFTLNSQHNIRKIVK